MIAAIAPTSFAEFVGPYILPGLFTLIGAFVVGGFAIWNRRRGNQETKLPTVQELWEQQAREQRELDIERALRRQLQTMFYTLVDAFNSFATRVRKGGSTDLTPTEQSALDAEPTIPNKPHHKETQ